MEMLAFQSALPATLSLLGFGELWPILLVATVILAPLALWVWMCVECATKEPKEGNERLIWILVILLGNCLGALIYFFARRPARIRAETDQLRAQLRRGPSLG